MAEQTGETISGQKGENPFRKLVKKLKKQPAPVVPNNPRGNTHQANLEEVLATDPFESFFNLSPAAAKEKLDLDKKAHTALDVRELHLLRPARHDYLKSLARQLVSLRRIANNEQDPMSLGLIDPDGLLRQYPAWRQLLEQELIASYNKERRWLQETIREAKEKEAQAWREHQTGEPFPDAAAIIDESSRRRYQSLDDAWPDLQAAPDIVSFLGVLEQVENTDLREDIGVRGTGAGDSGIYYGPIGGDKGWFLANNFRKALRRTPKKGEGDSLTPNVSKLTPLQVEKDPQQALELNTIFTRLYQKAFNPITTAPSALPSPRQ